MSKSYRLVEIAHEVLASAENAEVEMLELSRLTSEYGRHIHPCKACFSTAAALCHWPCSCYPNYSLGQTQDWMNDIYPKWVAAHGVMIVTPGQLVSGLIAPEADDGPPRLRRRRQSGPDRDAGQEDRLAKGLELKGWDYPQHLAGRLFSVIVHGDTEGAGGVRRILSDWLRSMDLVPAGARAELDRYIGYWKPYATSHEELDARSGRAGRGAQCGLDIARSREGQEGRDPGDGRRKPEGAAAEVRPGARPGLCRYSERYFGADLTSASHFLSRRVRSATEPYLAVS